MTPTRLLLAVLALALFDPRAAVAALGDVALPLTVPQVFIGALNEPERLSDPRAVSGLLATGRIGLYWHFNGFYHQILNGTAADTVSLWEKTYAAIAELPYSTSNPASDTVLTVVNRGRIPTSLALGVKTIDKAGRSWSVVAPNLLIAVDGRPQACFRIGLQAYVLPPSATCLIDVQSDNITPVLLGSNQVETFAPIRRDLQIQSSDPVLDTMSNMIDRTPNGRPGIEPNLSFFTRSDPGGFRSLFTMRHDIVREINVNIDYQTSHTKIDLVVFRQYVDAAVAVGITSIAPVLQPDQSYTTGCTNGCFTNTFNTIYRDMATYGNGIAFDAPPWHALHYGIGYINWYESAIRWARRKGIRTSWIVSPMPNAQETFFEDTKRLLDILKRDHALPSQWIVENYRVQPGATTIESDANQGDRQETISGVIYIHPYHESLNAVAKLLAQTGNVAPPAPGEAKRLTISRNPTSP